MLYSRAHVLRVLAQAKMAADYDLSTSKMQRNHPESYVSWVTGVYRRIFQSITTTLMGTMLLPQP